MAKISGQIVSVSDSGDLITDIKLSDLESVPRDESLRTHCEGHSTVGIFPHDHAQPDMTFVAFEGTSGCVELSLVGDNASRFLGIKTGSVVELEW